MERRMYHTQEYRGVELEQPIKCYRDDAWLGEGYYFWYDILDAENWGEKSKKKTGKYIICEARIDCSNILDTVFNEDHYLFWLRQIEKTAKKIIKLTGEKPSLKEINDYFKERGNWEPANGVLFQDLPYNFDFLLVKPIQYRNAKRPFIYRKRIQLVVYNIDIVLTFATLKIEKS